MYITKSKLLNQLSISHPIKTKNPQDVDLTGFAV